MDALPCWEVQENVEEIEAESPAQNMYGIRFLLSQYGWCRDAYLVFITMLNAKRSQSHRRHACIWGSAGYTVYDKRIESILTTIGSIL